MDNKPTVNQKIHSVIEMGKGQWICIHITTDKGFSQSVRIDVTPEQFSKYLEACALCIEHLNAQDGE